jgi:general secretion pathway protein D
MTKRTPIFLTGCLKPTFFLVLAGLVALSATAALGADAKSEPAVTATAASSNSARFVSIDFNNVDINVFVKFISELTDRNFVIDQRVKGKVTIISPAKISIDEAYRVFLSVLEVHGFTTVPSGEVTKIIPAPDARTKNIDTRLSMSGIKDDDRVVTQLIPLTYASPDEVKRLLTPLVSKSSVILSYDPSNMLIITDVSSNLKRLTKLIEAIDVAGTGQKVTVLPVQYAEAAKLVKILSSVFGPTPANRRKGASSNEISFMADERTNSIIMLSGEAESERVKRLVALLDKETPRGKGNIHVYYLENASAEDIASVLQDIPQKGSSQTAPGKKTQPVLSQDVRITADKATNSLIITASKEDYEVIEDIIHKIDIPRAMVYIEALIMEVNVNKDFRLGTEWQAGDDSKYDNRNFIYGGGFTGSNLSTTDLTTGAVGLADGFSLGIFGEALNISGVLFPSISAVINAYKEDNDVQILSTPQILTTDNEEAKITVGKNVPFQTKSTTTDNDTYNSFEYRDVGKTLMITPHISKDRMVRLGISLEVTDLENAASVTVTPTTLKRTVETTVIVKDQGTVVIGGLIDDKLDTTNLKVPCLGDIPLLGWAFRTHGRTRGKTNLYIFLTPKVIKNPMEADAVYKDKRSQIEAAPEGTIKLYEEDEHRKPLELPAPQPGETSPQSEASPPVEDGHMVPQASRTARPDAVQEAVQEADASVNPDLVDKPYLIEVAAFNARPPADTLIKRLQAKGYPAYMQQVGGNAASGTAQRYRVRLGAFATLGEAQLYQQLVGDEGIEGNIITGPNAQLRQ